MTFHSATSATYTKSQWTDKSTVTKVVCVTHMAQLE
jgi:hypothetical protein